MVNSLDLAADWAALERKKIPSRRVSLEGKVFTRLTVGTFHGRDKNRRALWNCKCSCGNTKIVSSNALLTGSVKSCGCLMREYQHRKKG